MINNKLFIIDEVQMKKKRFNPYEIDIEYEQKTYKYVGRDYGDFKSANFGSLFNLIRFFRKRRNQKKEKYKFCNTYTEWENHVKKVVKKDIINSNDLIHWLYSKRNIEKQMLESVKTIFIPAYLAIFTTPYFYNTKSESYDTSNMVGGIIIVLSLIILVCFKLLYDAYERVNFYNDFIRIAEEELLEKQVKKKPNIMDSNK